VKELPGPDFTTYCKGSESAFYGVDCLTAQQLPPAVTTEPVEGDAEAFRPTQAKYSHEGTFTITHDQTSKVARGLACRAYQGNYWSITLRSDARNVRQASLQYDQLMGEAFRRYSPPHSNRKFKAQNYLGYCPAGYDKYSKLFSQELPGDAVPPAGPKNEIFLNDIYKLSKQLYDILLSDRLTVPSGLITVTGATDSSKSLITRGLIFLYLEASAKAALRHELRRPHLLTFEDPIEQYYIKDPATQSVPARLTDLEDLLRALNLDYTPRERRIDADNLSTVIRDAKRQTPAILFVGETRDWRDWKELLDFGGSGHLVITTSHAGSVIEAMTQIFRHTKTRTPSQRSEIARRILGIVNIQSFTPDAENYADGKVSSNVRALLPSVWKSTSQSMNNLVADGLSSILPARGREQELGYYGRTYFAHALLDDGETTKAFQDCWDKTSLCKKIMRKAREWDIKGA
jgi:hypothetical protein